MIANIIIKYFKVIIITNYALIYYRVVKHFLMAGHIETLERRRGPFTIGKLNFIITIGYCKDTVNTFGNILY